jgi:chaperonin GroEL (HSP60 family)
MQSSRDHAATCVNQLAAAIAELGRALARNAHEHPGVYLSELKNAKNRIVDAHEAICIAKSVAEQAVDDARAKAKD